MQQRLLAAALITVWPTFGVSHALAEELPVSANLHLASDYAFRGISQTDQRPAIQGGFDYQHGSGLYLGAWASNVSDGTAGIETNLYGGYRFNLGPVSMDAGLLRYYYPGHLAPANTTEAYAGLSWKFLSFTYSHTLTDAFGMASSKGSKYFDLSASHEIFDGLTLEAHYGWSRFRGPGNSADNYQDWSLGLSKTYRGLDFGLHYVDTDLRHNRLADERFILSVGKSF